MLRRAQRIQKVERSLQWLCPSKERTAMAWILMLARAKRFVLLFVNVIAKKYEKL